MAADFTLAKSYAKDMKTLGRGYGFYEPEAVGKVRRGMCGYIDSTGAWRHIIDLTNRQELEAQGFTSPGHLAETSPRKDEWGDVTSEGVDAIRSEFQVGGDAGVTGVQIRFILDSSRTSGAALICNNPAYREGFEYEHPLREWAKKNAARIAKKFPDAKTYGFYVVQSTWVSEDVWINAWKGARAEVSIGFSIRAANVGEVAPALRYTHERSIGCWVHPLKPDEDAPAKVVLFFKGLEFHIRGTVAGKAWIHETRGEDKGERFTATDPEDPTLEYAVECFRIGHEDRDEDGECEEDSDDD